MSSPQTAKGQSERDGLQSLGRLMNLLGMELVRLTPLDHLGSVYERRGPVETSAVCFSGKSAC
jgi:hypothetical protein